MRELGWEWREGSVRKIVRKWGWRVRESEEGRGCEGNGERKGSLEAEGIGRGNEI